jgi:hypothetical protein
VIDLDLAAPGLAIRAGISPRPDLADAAAGLADSGSLPPGTMRPVGSIRLVTGSHRPVAPGMARLVAEALVHAAPVVIADAGPLAADDPLLARADRIVVVGDGSPAGIVRLAEYLSGWHMPPPQVVVNRVRPGDRPAVLTSVRRWTGLEPAALVPDRAAVRLASRGAGPPDLRLARALQPVLATGNPGHGAAAAPG